MDEQASVTLEDLRGQCQGLEPVVLRAKLATEGELADHKPGGKANPQQGARGWLRYLIVLQRRHSALERGHSGGSDQNDFTRLQALAGAPETVLLFGVAEGGPNAVQVYPKSPDALMELHGRDLRLGFLATWRDELKQRPGTADALDLLLQTNEEILYQHKLVMWGVTTPGPRIPWTLEEPRPDPARFPAWLASISPLDPYRIAQAHQRVNNHRLQALEGLMAPDGAKGLHRPSWSVFLGSAAIELGVRPEELMHDWSLASIMVASSVSGAAKRMAAEASAANGERR